MPSPCQRTLLLACIVHPRIPGSLPDASHRTALRTPQAFVPYRTAQYLQHTRHHVLSPPGTTSTACTIRLSIFLSVKYHGSDAAAAPATSATDMPRVDSTLPHPVSQSCSLTPVSGLLCLYPTPHSQHVIPALSHATQGLHHVVSPNNPVAQSRMRSVWTRMYTSTVQQLVCSKLPYTAGIAGIHICRQSSVVCDIS